MYVCIVMYCLGVNVVVEKLVERGRNVVGEVIREILLLLVTFYFLG